MTITNTMTPQNQNTEETGTAVAGPSSLAQMHFEQWRPTLTQAPMVYIRKARDGWQAETVVTLFGQHILSILTRKASNGGIYSSASVGVREGRFMTHEVYRDFLCRISRSPARCTEKAIRDLHAASVEMIGQIALDAFCHYEALDELPPLELSDAKS